MSECESCKNKKNYPCPNSCGYMGVCDGYEPKPITHADLIRAMSDEELAEWFIKIQDDVADYYDSGHAYAPELPTMKENWLDWLKQEASE